ncbi:MAG: helix-turn-helix transcriptional regulator [Silvibacterium sp.]|nr:helix-turn-helix transcriptional regulator [Silvibacterium sp.]
MKGLGVSVLGYALLGVLQQQDRSGYDLRKFFSATPMISFSDSPGSIYPALRRLEERGLVKSRIQERSGLHRRRLYRLTPAGAAELRRWQKQPIVRDDIIRGTAELMLRFSFMDQSLGPAEALRFLTAFKAELAAYIPSLRSFLEENGKYMALSGRLALENGINAYESLLDWARNAIKSYEKSQERD